MLNIDQLNSMRDFFLNGNTQSYQFRKQQLQALKKSIVRHEEALHKALFEDLKKSPEESWVTETGFVIAEINAALSNLRDWMEPEYVPTNLVNLPSSSRVHREPLGVVLIIGPWNYPFQLLFCPLVGAIAAGNCIVLKPSEFAPATDTVMKQIISETFQPGYITYVQGEGHEVVPGMMNHFTFDHVFYTGSTTTGKIIYKMAAERMVPVTLELGGKSPCVVEKDADIGVAAKRIGMTKFSNAGQMCVAPDFILVHESVKDALVSELSKVINRFFGSDPQQSYNYGKMINQKQFERVSAYIKQGRVVHGGKTNAQSLFIEPTILEDVPGDASVMQDEIFGPVLPVISFNEKSDAMRVIRQHPNPLAFYVFTASAKKESEWLQAVPAGGACVNNASWHLTNHHLPFGGRGFSGTGNYHGKYSFDTFSHKKAVMKTPTWFDPSVKYPPFKGKLRLFKWVIR